MKYNNLKINVFVNYSKDYVIIDKYNEETIERFNNITETVLDDDKKNIVITDTEKIYSDRYNIFINFDEELDEHLDEHLNESTNNKNESYCDNFYEADSLGNAIEHCNYLIANNKAENIFIVGTSELYEYFFKSYYYNFLDKIIYYQNK
jgi:dihydrofolate reductase